MLGERESVWDLEESANAIEAIATGFLMIGMHGGEYPRGVRHLHMLLDDCLMGEAAGIRTILDAWRAEQATAPARTQGPAR